MEQDPNKECKLIKFTVFTLFFDEDGNLAGSG